MARSEVSFECWVIDFHENESPTIKKEPGFLPGFFFIP
jgi:hypothetical protein